MSTYKFKALTIAGSDSGGGAGIQADLKTFTSLEVFGTSVITSLTSQNTTTLGGIHSIPEDFVSQQLLAVLTDIGADAIKTGMLSNAEIIRNVAQTLREFYAISSPIPNFIVDPVMISSTGVQLLEPPGIEALITQILPLCHILTPNVPEALKILIEAKKLNKAATIPAQIGSIDEMKMAASALSLLGPTIVLLKGGHLPLDKRTGLTVSVSPIMEDSTVEPDIPMEVVDIMYDSRNGTFTEFRKPFLKVKNTHGTGCTLSAAITSYLAKGLSDLDAIRKSLDYVHAAIRTGFSVGKGNGPVNHFHGIVARSLELPSKNNPQPLTDHLIIACGSLWNDYIDHPFVRGIGDGSLAKECFVHYIIQDYFYLQNYARGYALAAAKSKTLAESKAYAATVTEIADETKMHLEYCARWGVSFEEIQATPESMANVAYTRYVLDAGFSGDVLDLLLAMAPCSLGYGAIGLKLMNDPTTLKGPANPYWDWIQSYAGKDYQDGMNKSTERVENMAAQIQPSPYRLTEMEKIFKDATKLEVAFWDMGLNRT